MSDIAANKKLFLEMVDRVVGNDDWASASQYFTDDFVAHGAGPKPTQLDGLQRLTRAWRRAFPDWHDEILDVVAENDLVVARLRASGTHLGRLLDIAPTGEHCQWGMIEIVRVRDGKIAEQWGYSDFSDVVSRLRNVASSND
ncbi:MAG TPA: ester cyclase [Acidimicrobiales bacterium]|nr:ester cyclase [Acidimicrobiales bacterium]